MDLEYGKFKVQEIQGRYVHHGQVYPFLDALGPRFTITELGNSVAGIPIKSVGFGTGPIKILAWSQMHGNESTTTKALLDIFSAVERAAPFLDTILSSCTLVVVPILNPDGALAYTRMNANDVDLNRDAQDLSQPESRLLRQLFDELQPDFCFNLHGQRTLFSAGAQAIPATLSFLAPAFNAARDRSPARDVGMKLIAGIAAHLQSHIPGGVGRYDDGFNANCVGDAFQMTDTPTMLFEAGHYPHDYSREQCREFVFNAMLKGLDLIATGSWADYPVAQYDAIPENEKRFFDILVHNLQFLDAKHPETTCMGIQYKEVLQDDKIDFVPNAETSTLTDRSAFGHRSLDLALPEDKKWLKDNGILAFMAQFLTDSH